MSDLVTDPSAVEYVCLNVGVQSMDDPDATDSVDLNVGVLTPADPDGTDYVYLGDVDDSVPTPHLWFVRPTSGRAGDGITVTGYGFGETQPELGGSVQVLEDGDTDWQTVTVTSWDTLAPRAPAYSDARQINPDGLIDPVHTTIDFTLPAGVVPPGVRIRVVTEA